jgi:hypothetical protein
MVIPGNIGYLNQFFSVQIFTENAAPLGSGLSVLNVQAELILPSGPDRIPAADYDHPGDDPLRFASIGPDKIIQPVQIIARPGPDGVLGTADDIGRLHPGESGQAEFLVEGLQEGLHVMDLDLTADLEGSPPAPSRSRAKPPAPSWSGTRGSRWRSPTRARSGPANLTKPRSRSSTPASRPPTSSASVCPPAA